jgi:glycerol-3-phosphate acyltransferase PlsY
MPPRLPAALVLAVSYLAGAVPVSGLVARRVAGVDLRQVGTGTVSGTGLYRVAGLGPLLVGGIGDVAKGTIGPLLAGRSRPRLRAAAGAAAVVGHNWSVFLRGAGGRGISPALGALAVSAPEGWAVVLAGLTAGKAVDATSLGAFVSYLVLPIVLWRTRGRDGLRIAVGLVAPMLLKRVLGNRPASGRVLWIRLLFDQDDVRWPRPWR